MVEYYWKRIAAEAVLVALIATVIAIVLVIRIIVLKQRYKALEKSYKWFKRETDIGEIYSIFRTLTDCFKFKFCKKRFAIYICGLFLTKKTCNIFFYDYIHW